MEEVKSKHTSFVVDAGDLTWKSTSLSEIRIEQQRTKAALQFDVYASGGIDAMVPGEADLALGVEWLSAAASKYELPYVAANLRCKGWTLPPGRVVERDGVRVAFIGVVGPKNSGTCGASSTVPAVSAAVKALGDADVHVLLSHQPTEDDGDLVRSVPEIDVVVNGHGRGQYSRPVALGQHAIQLAPGTRGKKLGVAEITLVPNGKGFEIVGAAAVLEQRADELRDRRMRAQDRVRSARNERARVRAEQRLSRLEKELSKAEAEIAASDGAEGRTQHVVSNHLWPLSTDVNDHPAVAKKVEAVKQTVETEALSAQKPLPDTQGRPFVGDRPCLACHTEQHAQWKATPHAYAWSTLVREKRSQDLDCWSCHVTGAHHPKGPKTPGEVGVLRNVGCESCHGPGKEHLGAPSKDNIVRQPLVQTCENCHDGIKDEGRFDYEKYLRKVKH